MATGQVTAHCQCYVICYVGRYPMLCGPGCPVMRRRRALHLFTSDLNAAPHWTRPLRSSYLFVLDAWVTGWRVLEPMLIKYSLNKDVHSFFRLRTPKIIINEFILNRRCVKLLNFLNLNKQSKFNKLCIDILRYYWGIADNYNFTIFTYLSLNYSGAALIFELFITNSCTIFLFTVKHTVSCNSILLLIICHKYSPLFILYCIHSYFEYNLSVSLFK